MKIRRFSLLIPRSSIKWQDEQLLRIASHFSFLLTAGLPLLTALDSMLKRESRSMKKRLTSLRHHLQQGHSLSEAFQQLGLPSFFLFCLRMAEMHGDYAQAFQTIEKYYQERIQMKEERRQLLRYPLILLTFILLTFLFFLLILLPRLSSFYASFHVPLPPLVQSILQWTEWLSSNGWIYLLLSSFLFVLLFGWLIRRDQLWFTRWMNSSWFPLHSFFQSRFTLFFTRALSILLQAGIPILQAIREMILSTPNRWTIPILQQIEEQLLQGKRLTETLEHCAFITDECAVVVAIAEEGGGVGDQLHRYGHLLQVQQRKNWERRLQWLQPVLFLLLGAVILIMFSLLFQPMFGFLQRL
ncbi:type II secretion system F family protein [Rubeoparvulum massiliense]|uniref:type II secretion system F family protein n=1 Tax=Rubeoparvulum massiliense TaxID=1631346 RepID=UPI00065E7626|nr:type II secretion system F family protein [Rubeoparvulum massiliense]